MDNDFYIGFCRVCRRSGRKPCEVIAAADLSRSSLGGWKHEKSPTLRTVGLLADALGLSAWELVRDIAAEAKYCRYTDEEI